MKSFDQQVADWARTKPADDKYDYGSNDDCALCQFLREGGFAKQPRVGGDYWKEGLGGARNAFSEKLELALASGPYTFGALADRLSVHA
jgi:hypothetical protein